MKQEPFPYEDIVGLPHHVSARHPQMPLSDRAAQFSPFAALTGHEAAIQETARLTEAFAELDEDRKELLDERLRAILGHLAEGRSPEVEVTYFQPDPHKDGGTYRTFCGVVKGVDGYRRRILFTDGTEIPIENIISL